MGIATPFRKSRARFCVIYRGFALLSTGRNVSPARLPIVQKGMGGTRPPIRNVSVYRNIPRLSYTPWCCRTYRT